MPAVTDKKTEKTGTINRSHHLVLALLPVMHSTTMSRFNSLFKFMNTFLIFYIWLSSILILFYLYKLLLFYINENLYVSEFKLCPFNFTKNILKINILVNTSCFLCGLLVSLTQGMNSLATLRSTLLFVLMQSGFVNGYQLLCDAHTVLESHRETAALFLFYSLSSFSAISFYAFVTLTVPISFLGCLCSLC